MTFKYNDKIICTFFLTQKRKYEKVQQIVGEKKENGKLPKQICMLK